jgi:putative ABC transport system permease protein
MAVSERSREGRNREGRLAQLGRDIRYGFRGLVRSPTFSLVAIATLALGIGANSALYTMIRGILIEPLPYPHPERLVRLEQAMDDGTTLPLVSYPNFADWRREAQSLDAVVATQFPSTVAVVAGGEAFRVPVMGVSQGYLQTLGAHPMVGRLIQDDENTRGGSAVVVVSERFWRERLGADPDLAAHTIQFFNVTWNVVGVIPDEFRDQFDADVWWPFELNPPMLRTAHNYHVTGRLAPDVRLQTATAEMEALGRRMSEAHAGQITMDYVKVTPLRAELVGAARTPLLLLGGAALLLLLVACANLAAALLARNSDREHELSVRYSLGAGRSRIARQLLTESLLLALAGAAAALLVASLAVAGVRRYALDVFPRVETLHLGASTLLFTGLAAVVTTLLFGLLPAMRQARVAGDVLRQGGRATGRRNQRLWQLLLAGEVALALVLSIGAGLMLRTFQTILSGDQGYDPRGVLAVELSLPASVFPETDDAAGFWGRVLPEVGGMAGADAVAAVNELPAMSGDQTAAVIEEGGSFDRREDWVTAAGWRVATPSYFDVMRTPILQGRGFDQRDRAGAPLVTVVNQSFAHRVWGDEDPIGRRVMHAWDTQTAGGGEFAEVIGVVADARDWRREAGTQPEMFVSVAQRPQYLRSGFLLVRSSGDPSRLAGPIRSRIRAENPLVPMEIRTLRDVVTGTASDRRFTLQVLAAFAATAVLLALIGIWGIVSYGVARRTREIGIRLALGAERREVVGMIQHSAMFIVAGGVVVGILAAWAATRLLQTLLFGVAPTDPASFGGAAVVLVATAAAASWLPARRASRVDPARTLKEE